MERERTWAVVQVAPRRILREAEDDHFFGNALAETINGPFKTELIKCRAPWRTLDHVEIATAELEDAYYAHHRAQPTAELSHR